MTDPVYVSITGLRLNGLWHAPVFWWHAIASMNQARGAVGCLSAEARTINGIHHTRSVWVSQDAMRAYLTTGAHLTAMTLFKRIATGKTFGFETRDVPGWDQVHALWLEKGRPA